MQEREVEKYLVERVKKIGGRAYKFVSPGNAGVPDRLACFPGGCVRFVEVKAPGGKQTTLQQNKAEELRRLGFEVRVVDSIEQVNQFMREVISR